MVVIASLMPLCDADISSTEDVGYRRSGSAELFLSRPTPVMNTPPCETTPDLNSRRTSPTLERGARATPNS